MTIKAQEVSIILTPAEIRALLGVVYSSARDHGVPLDRVLASAPPVRAAAIRKLQEAITE